MHKKISSNRNVEPLKKLPLVSVITIVFNNVKTIEQTIKSVLNQSYENIEYIIIDGGSTDGTIEIIEKYNERIDYWVSENDNGISDAFNKGIKKASGELIGIINSDDWYEIDAVEQIILNKKTYENILKPLIVFGKTFRVKQNGEREEKKSNRKGWHVSVPFSHCSSFVTREYYSKYGVFDNNYKIAMDVDLLMRGMKNAMYIELECFIGNQRDGGISEENRVLGYKEYYQISKRHLGAFKSLIGYYYKMLIFLSKKITIGGSN